MGEFYCRKLPLLYTSTCTKIKLTQKNQKTKNQKQKNKDRRTQNKTMESNLNQYNNLVIRTNEQDVFELTFEEVQSIRKCCVFLKNIDEVTEDELDSNRNITIDLIDIKSHIMSKICAFIKMYVVEPMTPLTRVS